MCSNETSPPPASPVPLLPYGVTNIKILLNDPTSATPVTMPQQPHTLLPLDQYRLQLYNYAVQAERLRTQQYLPGMQLPVCPGYTPYHPRLALSMSLFNHRILQPEEPKPQHSYIGLIAMAILSSPEAKLVLSDIYQYILDNYPYFRTRGPGWRNSIRHNLSLNDCFIKAGRSANGKGHYWAIHPANVEDFKKGDFRRRKAQRKVRKHMGLAVDDDGNDSPSPPPMTMTPPPTSLWPPVTPLVFPTLPTNLSRKRQFDVASLLAPDDDLQPAIRKRLTITPYSSDEEDIDVVSSENPREKTPPTSATSTPTTPGTPPAPWAYRHPGLPEVARYYEQLAAQHQARRIQALQSLQRGRSPPPDHDDSAA
ncbi:fork head domain-containing protein FD5-like [Macrosteles quadrilineatus]|uniref:fork head domain-containing protein FD5-like n=1 Tax=Macrosteles quadrilineatus TaxID=74068 RepID=UPI0023E1FD9C|nr:fork head domain-containing protein FD5-like [Macrosteles quadrilineatus]